MPTSKLYGNLQDGTKSTILWKTSIWKHSSETLYLYYLQSWDIAKVYGDIYSAFISTNRNEGVTIPETGWAYRNGSDWLDYYFDKPLDTESLWTKLQQKYSIFTHSYWFKDNCNWNLKMYYVQNQNKTKSLKSREKGELKLKTWMANGD